MADLTAAAIRNTRSSMGLTPAQFSDLLGCSPSSVYRWEASDGTTHVDPMAARIIPLCKRALDDDDVVQEIRTALTMRGPLWGLHTLLTHTLRADQEASMRDEMPSPRVRRGKKKARGKNSKHAAPRRRAQRAINTT